MDNFEEEALYKRVDELNAEITRLCDLLVIAKVALMHYERRGFKLGIVARDALDAIKGDE